MAGSVNKVILVGNLGRDPEVRTLQNGNKIANFTLATSESWKDKDSGEKREKVEWHRVVVFNERLVGNVEQVLRKGAQVYLEGALQTRKWVDQAGTEHYSTEVVIDRFRGEITFLRTPRDDDRYGADDRPSRTGTQRNAPAVTDALDEDIPF